MDNYKIDIEAIVHPLIAPEQRKNTLRRELWAHFCALAEEERHNGADETAAAQTAFARLGKPQAIRDAFIENIPRAERWLARLDRRPDEPSNAYIRRVARTMFPFLAVVPICFGIQCSIAEPDHAIIPWSIMLTLSLWLPLFLYAAMRRTAHWQALLRQSNSIAPFFQHYTRHAAISAVMTAAFILPGYALLAAWRGPHDATALSYLYMATPVLAFQWLTLTTLFAYALIREKQAANTIAHWPYTQRPA